MTAKIQYRGWAGHFICSAKCLFRLNTLVSLGECRVVVSTVGAMLVDFRGKKEFDEVGCDRYYETMVFHAQPENIRGVTVWDADVSKQISVANTSDWANLEDEFAAQEGHEAIVQEIIDKIESGSLPAFSVEEA